jgi:hypothetical protein
MTSATATFRQGYIVDRWNDYVWFLALPFVAIALALLAQEHVPGNGRALIAFFITTPHHFATWLRVYGSPQELRRHRTRLILGPILLIGFAYGLTMLAPFALLLVILLWDHQHSIMQQYGFSRVYDFKAQTGAPSTPKFDFYFNWIFFVNMLVVAPLWTTYWVRLLHEWHVPITTEMVLQIQQLSWTVAIAYGAAYVGQIAWCIRKGYPLNPLKYLFLFSSYFLWYYTSFSTAYLLVFVIAHRIMHGIQYIVMAYFYNRNHVTRSGGDSRLLAFLGKPRHVAAYVFLCAVYALIFDLLTKVGERSFSFGSDIDLFGYSLVSSFALTHYYFDSFIWKVRRPEVQHDL